MLAAAVFAAGVAVKDGLPQRVIRVRNECPHPIRVQNTGGAAYSLTCKKDSDCPSGLVCDPTVPRPGGKKGGCYFSLNPPVDNGGSLDLLSGKYLTLQMPTTAVPYRDKKDNPQMQSWNGNIFASTGCAGLPGGTRKNCLTGICFNNNFTGFGKPGVCEGSLGPDGPVTRVEMSLQQGKGTDGNPWTSYDFYDVTMLDGVNLPATVKPIYTTMAPCPGDAKFCRYWCGNPGSAKPLHPELEPCSWDFKPDEPPAKTLGKLGVHMKWVDVDFGTGVDRATPQKPPKKLCDVDSDCPGDEVCGFMGQVNDQDLPMSFAWSRQCGRHIGWMVANGACKWTAAWDKTNPTAGGVNGLQGPFMCKENAGSDIYQNLYGCVGQYLDSGYLNTGSAHTCGCPNWTADLGINAPAGQMNCKALTTSNASGSPWLDRGLPWAAVLKKGCPTAYSFPFDDASSTFQCRSQVGSDNMASYEITFCPDGKTGLGPNGTAPTPSPPPSPPATPSPPAPPTPPPAVPTPPPTPAPPAPTPAPASGPWWLCAAVMQQCVEVTDHARPDSYSSQTACQAACSASPATPAPPAPTPAPHRFCVNGVRSSDGRACCPYQCSSCSWWACDFGDSECCDTRIEKRGRRCKDETEVSCVIPTSV